MRAVSPWFTKVIGFSPKKKIKINKHEKPEVAKVKVRLNRTEATRKFVPVGIPAVEPTSRLPTVGLKTASFVIEHVEDAPILTLHDCSN